MPSKTRQKTGYSFISQQKETFLMNKVNATRGFTLIELLVVIAIIGILSSVVLASLNSAREKGRDARRVSDIKQIQLALELYYDSNGSYPSSLAAVASSSYISTVPTDPSDQSAYFYEQLSSGSNYVVGATLETTDHSVLDSDVNGTVGTTDCTDPVYCAQP